MDSNRVVITGVGALCCVGNTVPDIWDALITGRSGIGPVTKFDATAFRSRVAGELHDFDVSNYLPQKEARRLDPFCHYAVAASAEALAQSQLLDSSVNRRRVGVIIGSGIGGVTTFENQVERLLALGPSKTSPFLVPMMIGDMASGSVSIHYGFQGPNFGIASACATGTHAIGEAYATLKRGHADVILAGGTEASVTPICMAGFCALKALTGRNDDPQRASRPFDAQRDGFVLAEGAGVVVLETLAHASRRGAEPIAEVVGYAASGDGYHLTAPPADGNGAVQAIQGALSQGNIRPDEISYINAHGTSTPMNDRVETQAIKTACGTAADTIYVTSTKALTGHTLGAAGGLETAICAQAIAKGEIPGTYNYEFEDPDCDLNYLPNRSIKQDVEVALNMNFGFGGHNAVIALRKFHA